MIIKTTRQRKKVLVPRGIWWRKDIAWKKENHFPDSLFTVFAGRTSLMQHNITVVCVNDNNPPGLSISTRSLWPARQGQKRALVNRGLWVLQFTVAKIAEACDYRHGSRARERPGRGLMKLHTDTNDWARCFSSWRGIQGTGQRQVRS